MKGIVLAGGLGTRLEPITKITNKHLLPVFDKPMIFYPLETLAKAGIKEVMVVVSGPHAGDFVPILKNGKELGFDSLSYAFQEKANGGIADALSLAKDFIGYDNVAVILGDNTTDANLKESIESFESKTKSIHQAKAFGKDIKEACASIYLKEVKDPCRFGIAEIENEQVISIVEKPDKPKTNLAVTGFYLYTRHVFDFIDKCSPSERGELEITDVNNMFIRHGVLWHNTLEGFWKDAGTFRSLFEASKYWAEKKI